MPNNDDVCRYKCDCACVMIMYGKNGNFDYLLGVVVINGNHVHISIHIFFFFFFYIQNVIMNFIFRIMCAWMIKLLRWVMGYGYNAS